MFRLTLFGTASLVGKGGPITGRAAQGRRMALLALLALSRGRAVTRDKLVAVLFPEAPPERARHQLSDDLYIIRGALGDLVVRSVADEVALNADVLVSDVEEFERLLDEGDCEAAVASVAGPLMDGFHLADSAEFERFLDGERDRLGQRYASALATLAEGCEARGDHAAAARWWRQLAAQDPFSGRVALRLMQALEAAGDRASAIRHARIHATLLREELDAAPDVEVAAFAEVLRLAPSARAAAATPSSVAEPGPEHPPASGSPSAEAAVAAVEAAAPPAGWRGAAPRRARLYAALAFALVLAAIGLQARPAPAPAAARHAASVGVLPFVNMSAEPENAYFSDGLSEQIIAALSRIEGLRVAARTSSFALRENRMDVRAIGDTLGVAAVLEGSVRKEGNRLRITAQLIDASTGYHIWTDEYARDLEDVFAVQEEIARAIAAALELRLAAGSSRRSVRQAVDLEAYDQYLRGLYLRNDLTREALLGACDHFDRAIALQPDFAAAYAGKASVVAPLILFGHIDRREGTRDFRALTARALELDPNLGEAHVALGILKLFFDWDWQGAERALRRALELNPNDAHAYHHLGNYLRAMGRLEEAVAARARGVALDPLNARTVILFAADYFVLGDHGRALEQYQRAQRTAPLHPLLLGSGPWMPGGPAMVYSAQGRHDEALEEYLRLATLRGATPGEVSAIRAGYDSGGMPGFWRSWMAMDERQSGGRGDALRTAKLLVLSGDTAAALAWLDSAYAERNLGLIFLGTDPTLAGLRAHPRGARIVRAMKLPVH